MNRLDRQSFLGKNSDCDLATATVGFVGLGGGGSHNVQQFAHLGLGGYVLVDPDAIDLTNTNRLVGGTLADVEGPKPKVEIAERQIRGLQPGARIKALPCDWRLALEELKICDLILGSVDSFKDRDQLERFCRRYLIPYIDIGMDVLELPSGEFFINGQVILSMPGYHCLRCCNFITEDRLAREAEKYGAAGSKPQVVWSNGVLASTAVGIGVKLLTPWYKHPAGLVYMEYDGNRNTISTSHAVAALSSRKCTHYLDDETGDPAFDIRELLKEKERRESDSVMGQSQARSKQSIWQRIFGRWIG